MTLFDLIFILFFLASAASLLLVLLLEVIGRRKRAATILKWLTISIVIYAVIVLVTSLLSHRRELRVGEPLCFDDWCITIENAQRAAASSGATYTVYLRLFSQARGITQRENNLAVYLTDAQGKRYDPFLNATDVPFNVQLSPAQSVSASRTFQLPSAAQVSGVVIAH